MAISDAKVSANVADVTCPPALNTNLVMCRCPSLTPGVTKMMFVCSTQVKPHIGTTVFTVSINEVDGLGVFKGNIAYWPIEHLPATGKRGIQTYAWLYDPRAAAGNHVADVNLGDGSNRYLALAATPTGGIATCRSSILQVIAGDFEAITNDETTGANLLTDSQGL